LEKQTNAYNSQINSAHSNILNIASRLKLNDTEPTIERIAEELRTGKKKEYNVINLFDEYINISKATKRPSTIRQYEVARRLLKEFKPSVTFDQINGNFFEEFKIFLQKKEHKQNTIGNRIKVLRSFLNYWYKLKYPVRNDFKDIQVTKKTNKVIYLELEEINQLYNYQFNQKYLERTRDLFCFQCNVGLRLGDLMRLEKHHIKNGCIEMDAGKTGKAIYVPLNKIALDVLKKYDFSLPRLSEKNYNEYIKLMAREAGLDRIVDLRTEDSSEISQSQVILCDILSSHKAVSTFITLASEKGISVKTISEITGKSVKIIIDHYLGTSKENVKKEMRKKWK
jgi:integrase